MNIYLVQHGKQVPKEEDPERPLAEQGRADVEKVATFLKKAGIEVDKIFHSGKTRARQTAEILATHINPGKEPLEKTGLSPLDEVRAVAEEITQRQEDLMIVGHLPHLAKLASLLTTGSDSNLMVSFQQGGVMCLRFDEDTKSCTVAWMMVPEIIK